MRSTSRRTARRTTPTAACARPATATRREHLKDPMKAKPANPFGQGDTADERSGGLPDLPQRQPQPRVLDVGQALAQRGDVHELPQHPRGEAPPSYSGEPGRQGLDQQVHDDVPAQPGGDLRQCHQPIRAANFKPSHHPIIEGKVKCTDCHNPHGALSPAMVKQPTINDQCYSCHADKRGPYVFNHPPVEENCATCHNPHGSVHAQAPERVGAEPLPGLPRRLAAPRHGLRRGRRLHLRRREPR